MEQPRDLKRVLAEEIRAAIAEVSPAPGGGDAQGGAATAEARGALDRAAAVMTPSVPDAAPLALLKRLAIRALRFLWRNQSDFNALSSSAGAGLADALDRLDDRLDSKVDELHRRLGVSEARLTLLESAGPAPRGASAAPAPSRPAAEIPAGVYALFEERFRGNPSVITEAQRFYLDFLRDLPGPVLDVGCGRGEFLRLLAAAGITARGIEVNPVTAAAGRAAGLEIEEGDALALLERLPAGRLGAVVAFQVVEHWSPGEIFRFLQAARRALGSGGVLVAETINSDSLSALRAFYLDPTHVRPVPPEALQFLAEAAGFTETRIEYRSPLPASARLKETSEDARRLNALLYAPQDYALIGRAPVVA
jgi:O-antigen chain-terminating methyltransferase